MKADEIRLWVDATAGTPPPLLVCPTTFEPTVGAPVCSVRFRAWAGAPIDPGNYGRKPVVDFGGEALFAELAVVRWLQRDGWDAGWVARYGGLHLRSDLPGRPTRTLPVLAQALFDRLNTGGSWDVFAWQGAARLAFIECKRIGRDRYSPAQIAWIRPRGRCAASRHSSGSWSGSSRGNLTNSPRPRGSGERRESRSWSISAARWTQQTSAPATGPSGECPTAATRWSVSGWRRTPGCVPAPRRDPRRSGSW